MPQPRIITANLGSVTMTSAIRLVQSIRDAVERIGGWEEPTSADPIRPDGVQVEIVGSVRYKFEIFRLNVK